MQEWYDFELRKKFYVTFGLKELLKYYNWALNWLHDDEVAKIKEKADYLLKELIDSKPLDFLLPEIMYTLLKLYPECLEV